MQTIDAPGAWLATGDDRAKVRLPGTTRAQPPEATLEMARRAAQRVGVTRVADITRLDTIGIPTYQAIRPLSRTLAVSQGKGVTAELARLSAMLESVEIWHVEQPMPPAVTGTPAELADRLGYDVAALARSAPSLLHDALPLAWVPGRSLGDGTPTLLPRDVVRLSLEAPTDWQPPVFFSSTNGLASGNTRVEAVLHGLYEVIERDAVTASVQGGDRGVRVDPRSGGVADDLCTAIERAGVAMEVRLLPSGTGLPVFLAWLSCDDYPAAMYGFGCHLDPEIALTRAITEAAQTRLSYVAGARDDLQSDIDDGGVRRRKEPSGPVSDLADVLPLPVDTSSLADDLAYVTDRATAAFAHCPLVADLTRDDIGVPVVKVVAPGARICPEVL
ncbi:YcaO-like family protein [Krasilnikovia sp. MM14-A1259]|uniref:YcaO-like family protein n=1 Tax=Krasilnikovia sp. MM14-A1259 TaxID=3373539 RepID=UPI0038270196